MFFELSDPNDTLVNSAVDPIITEYDRMVYLALSEFFFDSGMFSYYKAEIFQMNIVNEKVTCSTQTHELTTYWKPTETLETIAAPQNSYRLSEPVNLAKQMDKKMTPEK